MNENKEGSSHPLITFTVQACMCLEGLRTVVNVRLPGLTKIWIHDHLYIKQENMDWTEKLGVSLNNEIHKC
jgi:hypothetical protein